MRVSWYQAATHASTESLSLQEGHTKHTRTFSSFLSVFLHLFVAFFSHTALEVSKFKWHVCIDQHALIEVDLLACPLHCLQVKLCNASIVAPQLLPFPFCFHRFLSCSVYIYIHIYLSLYLPCCSVDR